MHEKGRKSGEVREQTGGLISRVEAEMEARENEALTKIFSYLQENALRTGKPINAGVLKVPVTLRTKSGASEFALMINPAIVRDGKLTVVVFDLYNDGLEAEGEEESELGKHLLSWVASADWDNDQIIYMTSNINPVEENTPRINLATLAEYICERFEEKLGIDQQPTAKISKPTVKVNVPPNYARRVN